MLQGHLDAVRFEHLMYVGNVLSVLVHVGLKHASEVSPMFRPVFSFHAVAFLAYLQFVGRGDPSNLIKLVSIRISSKLFSDGL